MIQKTTLQENNNPRNLHVEIVIPMRNHMKRHRNFVNTMNPALTNLHSSMWIAQEYCKVCKFWEFQGQILQGKCPSPHVFLVFQFSTFFFFVVQQNHDPSECQKASFRLRLHVWSPCWITSYPGRWGIFFLRGWDKSWGILVNLRAS